MKRPDIPCRSFFMQNHHGILGIQNTMNDTIVIRPFTSTDLTENDQILETLKALTVVSDISTEARSQIAEILTNPPYYVFVAEEDRVIVGTTTLLAEQKIARGGGICGHIEDVAVHADHQGKGIGSKLLTTAIDKARELGCYKIILDCSDANMSYYEKFGFTKVENCMRIDL